MSEAGVTDLTSILGSQNLACNLSHNKSTVNIGMSESLLNCVAVWADHLVCWESCSEQGKERKINQSWASSQWISCPQRAVHLTQSQAFENICGSCQKILRKQKSFRSEKHTHIVWFRDSWGKLTLGLSIVGVRDVGGTKKVFQISSGLLESLCNILSCCWNPWAEQVGTFQGRCKEIQLSDTKQCQL